MKKNILITVAIVTTLTLLFLLTSDSKKNKVDNSLVIQEKIQTTVVEDEYLWGLHSFHEDRIEEVSDNDLIIAGQNSCSLLDEGYPIPNVAIYLVSSEKSVNGDFILANEIIANSIFTFCKEFISQLNAMNP